MQVENAMGEAESEEAYILVEAVDIFGMIERHLETKRMTLKSLFMQFLRSQVTCFPLSRHLQGCSLMTGAGANIKDALRVFA